MALSWRTRQKKQNWIIAGYKNWKLSQKALNLRKSVIWNAYYGHSVPLRWKNFKKNHWIKSLSQKVQYNVSFSSFRYIFFFGEKWFRGILGIFLRILEYWGCIACEINLKKGIFSILYILPVRLIVPQIHHTSKMVFSDLTKYMTKGPIICFFDGRSTARHRQESRKLVKKQIVIEPKKKFSA